MKFRYYIVWTDTNVTGTNEDAVAKEAAEGFPHVCAVIDTETNLDLTYSTTLPIPEETDYVLTASHTARVFPRLPLRG